MPTLPIYYNNKFWLECRLDLIEEGLPGMSIEALKIRLSDLDNIEMQLTNGKK